VAKYTWFDGKVIPGPIDLHGIRAFLTDTVQKKGSRIVIRGQSSTLVRVGAKLVPMGKIPARLEIDLQGPDASTVFPKLQEALFFPSLAVALQSLPEYVSDLLPYSRDGRFESKCHCSYIFQDGKWVGLEANDHKLRLPAMLKAAETPVFDQVSGTLALIFSVSDVGRVEEVWVAAPLASGVDESKAKSLRESTFNPATLDGKPVGAVLIQTLGVN